MGSIVTWAQQEKYSSVFEMTREVASDLSDDTNVTLLAIALIGVTDEYSLQDAKEHNSVFAPKMQALIDLMKTASKVAASASSFKFVWMDVAAVEWRSFVEAKWKLTTADTPILLVYNLKQGEYYRLPQADINLGNVTTFLDDIVAGKLTAMGSASSFQKFFSSIAQFFYSSAMSVYTAWIEYPQLFQVSFATCIFCAVALWKV